MQVDISQDVWVRQQKKREIIQFDKLLAGLKKAPAMMNLVQPSKQTQSTQASKAKSKNKKISKTVA